MNDWMASRLIGVGVVFFGTLGLGLCAHGIYQFIRYDHNYWLLLIATLGLSLFGFCWLVGRQLRQK